MSNVHDDAGSIHLRDRRAAEIADAAVSRFRAPIAENVAPIVSQMHHANAELKEQPDVRQFVRNGIPFLRQRNPVAGEIEAMPAILLRAFDVVWCGGSRNMIA